MTGSPSQVLVIVGPTAAGKSAVAEALADRTRAEVISADSMQVYRGMDIATDKPRQERRVRYHYHMIDVADPGEAFTVVRFRELARDAITGIASRGRLPILVGGSGLYVRAVIDDLDFPPATRDLSVTEANELETASAEDLYKRLQRLDPEAAKRIQRNNRRRVARALEFIAETGQPFSQLQERWSRRQSIYDVRIFGLDRPRPSLCADINRRIDDMIAAGLVEEARRIASDAGAGATARQALGHKELAGYLAGTQDLGEAVDSLRRATKRFAKRQMTWFRRDDRVEWVDADDVSAEVIAERIIDELRADGWLSEKLLRTGA